MISKRSMVTLGLLALILSQGIETQAEAQSGAVALKAGAEAGDVETLVVHLGQSEVVTAPWPTKRVSVTDPKVADIKILTPRQVLVQGVSLGATDLIMWSESDEVRRARVVVEIDLGRQEALLARLFPDCRLDLTQSDGVLIVTGVMARAEQAAELHRFFDNAEIRYADMTRVAGGHQVQINVRVAEVSRQSLRQMGINIFHTGHDFFGVSQVGSAAGGAINPVSIGPVAGTVAARNLPFTFNANVDVSPAVTLFAGFPTADVEMFFQALAENQYLRILAEPTLVALSGEEASFLAGGEYPVPVVQGGDQGGTSITVTYREYGVRLRFKPRVLGDGTIQLYVAPEVSEISDVGAVLIEGFNIPSVVTRKAETTLEMKSGQTFAMAGLINQTTNARVSRVPLLGELPVLGSLFRSVRYTTGETELVVLATVSLVEPLSLATLPPPPGVLHVAPNDWELYVDGKIEGAGPAKVSDADAVWLKQLGFDRLTGPGGWVRHDAASAQSESTMAPGPVVTAGEQVGLVTATSEAEGAGTPGD